MSAAPLRAIFSRTGHLGASARRLGARRLAGSNTPLRPWISTRPGRILEGVEGYCAVACLGLADDREAGEITGAWLVWYDPAGNNGDGDAAWSHDPADAARFTEREWAELYAAAPANRLRRPDGKPNRPIAIFNGVPVVLEKFWSDIPDLR